MLILSLSTSGPVASAALISADKTISKSGSGLTHSETIMPLCEAVLQEAGVAIADIDAFAVDVGPGSFTGVRIGVCAANAMAAALNKPVIAVSSLEALLGDEQNACALLDCRNGNGYAMANTKSCTLPPSAVVISELLEYLPDNVLIIGDGQMHKERILAALPNARFAEVNQVTAEAIGVLAGRKLINGETAAEAMPLYLRPSQAERLAKEKK